MEVIRRLNDLRVKNTDDIEEVLRTINSELTGASKELTERLQKQKETALGKFDVLEDRFADKISFLYEKSLAEAEHDRTVELQSMFACNRRNFLRETRGSISRLTNTEVLRVYETIKENIDVSRCDLIKIVAKENNLSYVEASCVASIALSSVNRQDALDYSNVGQIIRAFSEQNAVAKTKKCHTATAMAMYEI